MASNQKGITLIELVVVLLMFSIVASGATIGSKLIHEIRLKAKAEEVIKGIEYAKQGAATTGRPYLVMSFEKTVYICKEGGVAIYVIPLKNGIRIPKDSAGKIFTFKGTMAPNQAGTIILQNQNIKKQVRLTIGVGTGKVRAYYEKYN